MTSNGRTYSELQNLLKKAECSPPWTEGRIICVWVWTQCLANRRHLVLQTYIRIHFHYVLEFRANSVQKISPWDFWLASRYSPHLLRNPKFHRLDHIARRSDTVCIIIHCSLKLWKCLCIFWLAQNLSVCLCMSGVVHMETHLAKN